MFRSLLYHTKSELSTILLFTCFCQAIVKPYFGLYKMSLIIQMSFLSPHQKNLMIPSSNMAGVQWAVCQEAGDPDWLLNITYSVQSLFEILKSKLSQMMQKCCARAILAAILRRVISHDYGLCVIWQMCISQVIKVDVFQ